VRPTCGIQETGIDYLLGSAAPKKKLRLCLAIDAISIKPALGRLFGTIVGCHPAIIDSNTAENLEIGSVKLYKSLLAFMAQDIDDPKVRPVIALFPYNKKGFTQYEFGKKVTEVYNRLIKKASQKKIQLDIVGLATDQEAVFDAYINSESSPVKGFFDIPRIVKCLRNSLANNLLLYNNSLINIKMLMELRRECKLASIVVEDKTSVSLLYELFKIKDRLKLKPDKFMGSRIYPCEIYNQNAPRLLCETVSYSYNGQLQFYAADQKNLYTFPSSGNSKPTILAAIDNVTHIAGVQDNCLICVRNNEIVKFHLGLKQISTISKNRQGYKKCAILGSRIIKLTNNGNVEELGLHKSKTYLFMNFNWENRF